MKTVLIAAIGLMIILLFGCKEHKPVPPPEVKVNTIPKEQYEITLTIQEDPGAPISEVKGVTAYKVSNRHCAPVDYTRSLGGSRPMFFKEINSHYKETADETYITTLYRDRFINENYYGIEVCKWQVDAITVKFYIQGRLYTSGLSGNKITQGEIAENYCLKHTMSRQERIICVPETAAEMSKFDRSEFFKINISSKRM